MALFLGDLRGEAAHWTAAMMAKAAGISVQLGATYLADVQIAAAPDAPAQAVARP